MFQNTIFSTPGPGARGTKLGCMSMCSKKLISFVSQLFAGLHITPFLCVVVFVEFL